MISRISESLIVNIWQHQLIARTDLITEDGEPIRIVYPGRINNDQGADLSDAVIGTSHRLIKGDVEVHVKSSDWQAHRHHRDPIYNRVILHAVMWHDARVATTLQNGTKIPVLALHKYIQIPANQRTNLAFPINLNMPCHQALEHLPTSAVTKFLDRAGKKRFLVKAARFQADLAQVEASQVLYQGIMGALGYFKNKIPFLELARRVPIQALESLAKSKISDEEYLTRQQALLLGTAALLPSQRPIWRQKNNIDDRWIEKLEKIWLSFPQTEVISENDWHLCKVRPNNFPTRRIVAMSCLTLRYRENGIFDEVVKKIKEVAGNNGHQELEKLLIITTDGYWASHFDFGSAGRQIMPTLLGDSRAADIAVNVLLPFIFAWGKLTSQPVLARKALDLYGRYPRLSVNTMERHMSKQLGISSDIVSSAQRQQGLIHIYNTLCSQGKCRYCPLSKAIRQIRPLVNSASSPSLVR